MLVGRDCPRQTEMPKCESGARGNDLEESRVTPRSVRTLSGLLPLKRRRLHRVRQAEEQSHGLLYRLDVWPVLGSHAAI